MLKCYLTQNKENCELLSLCPGMLDVTWSETKLCTLPKSLHFLGSTCGKHTVLASDDEYVPEYAVHHGDEPDLEVEFVADERKI